MGRDLYIDAMGRHRYRTTADERFWRKVDASGGTDACWPWTGSQNPKGYGRLHVAGRVEIASRFSWRLIVGPIPDGMLVCHTCDNPPCVNPAHLFLGTQRDNARDMVLKGRSGCSANERSGKAKLSDVQVAEIRALVCAGETRQAVASIFGVHAAHVSRIVNGLRRPA